MPCFLTTRFVLFGCLEKICSLIRHLVSLVGNTDGMVEGRRYFRCEPNRGKFVRYEDITRVLETKVGCLFEPVLLRNCIFKIKENKLKFLM